MSSPARGSTELLSNLMAYLDDVDSGARSSIAHLSRAPSQEPTAGASRAPAPESEQPRSEVGSPIRASRPIFVWDNWEAKSGSDTEEKNSGAEAKADEASLYSASTLSPCHSLDGPLGANGGTRSRSNVKVADEYYGATGNSQRVSAGSQMTSRSSAQSSTDTASAFRDVQAKVSAMQAELELRSHEVRHRQRDLQHARTAAQRAAAAADAEWAKRKAEAAGAAKHELEKQREFGAELAKDCSKLQEKRDALVGQAERLARRRNDEVAAVRRAAVESLRKERAQWVASEKARLSKLAVEKEPSLRDAAAQALEPTLHDLLKQQRLEVAQQAEALAATHREQSEAHARSLAQALQRLKQEVHAEHAREAEERRCGWTQDLAHALAEGERELDDVRASGAESLQTERSAHEAAWRRIKQEHDAENDEVRLATQQQARHAQQEHARSVEAQAARHQHHCQQLEQRRAAEDEQARQVVRAQCSSVRANLDQRVLAALERKCQNEASMVSQRLQAQGDDEIQRLTDDLERQRVHLEAQLLEARSRQGVFSNGQTKKMIDNGKDRHHSSARNDDDEHGLQGGVIGEGIIGGGVSQRQCAELRARISADREALSDAQQQLKALREQLRSHQADHAAHMYLLKQRFSEAKAARQDAVDKALSARRSAEAELESAQKQANETMKQASTEAEALKEAQMSEVAAVDSRVATVLARKESAVAELAEKLNKLTAANEQRSTALDRLRQGRAAA